MGASVIVGLLLCSVTAETITVAPTIIIRVKALICKNLKMTLYTQIYPAGHINLIFLILLHTRNRLGPVLAVHVMDDFDILAGYVAKVVH